MVNSVQGLNSVIVALQPRDDALTSLNILKLGNFTTIAGTNVLFQSNVAKIIMIVE